MNIGDDDKHMGSITNTSFALCWNGSWTEDEKMEANTVQDKVCFEKKLFWHTNSFSPGCRYGVGFLFKENSMTIRYVIGLAEACKFSWPYVGWGVTLTKSG